MLSYRKGRRFEWQVRSLFEENGWLVFRTARSKPVDLLALKNGNILLIECKYSSRLKIEEKSRLIELAEMAGGQPILAFREKYKHRVNLVNLKTGASFNL